MTDFLSWYILIVIIGLIAFPAAYRLFAWLPDRGYSLSRVFGLLLFALIFWLLTSLQITRNNLGGILFSLLLFSLLSIWSVRKNWRDLISWLKSQIHYLVLVESLFLLAFAAWSIVRSANPEIIGIPFMTEKPMELAFINAILRSPTFPPHDPWLSGYAISYYYFGYVMVAILARLTSVPAAMAFNLAMSLWFGMTAITAYGIVYNLLRSTTQGNIRKIWCEGWALLGPTFILLVSNIEGFLEMLHARGLFWRQSTDGSWTSVFWKWLNILELDQAPALPFSWQPERIGGTWWWRASRVVQDFDMSGQAKEIIDEFPFFSYLLADLHPHLLAMPFAILAIGLALNLYLRNDQRTTPRTNMFGWLFHWMMRDRENPPFSQIFLITELKKPYFWLTSAILGSLAFINTWDFPVYVALYCAVDTLMRYRLEGWSVKRVVDFIELGFTLGIMGVVIYLPFYIGFSSQAGGILPSLSFYTRGLYFWVMFLPFLFPIFFWLIKIWRSGEEKIIGNIGIKFSFAVIAGLWLFSYLFGWLVVGAAQWAEQLSKGAISPDQANLINKGLSWGGLFFFLHGTDSPVLLLLGSLGRRLSEPGTWLTLLILLALIWGFIANKKLSSHGFIFVLALIGCGLAIAPEFIYLRDFFGWRINTIFKFYFQVWILWGIVAAYVSVILWHTLKGAGKIVFRIVWIMVILMSLAYPLFGLLTKTNYFKPETWTLDGEIYVEKYSPDEMEAIQWLNTAPLGIIVESVGGSYSGYARISAQTGLPAVLGWPFHESQWRGGAEEIGSREKDIQMLFSTSDWDETQMILEQYQIRYVYIGLLERSTYRVIERKFQSHLKPVFQNNTVIIYQYLADEELSQSFRLNLNGYREI